MMRATMAGHLCSNKINKGQIVLSPITVPAPVLLLLLLDSFLKCTLVSAGTEFSEWPINLRYVAQKQQSLSISSPFAQRGFDEYQSRI